MGKYPGITQAEYARHRGVTPQAVQVAIKSGRLRTSLIPVQRGARKVLRIESIKAADTEWLANTLDLGQPTIAPEGMTAKARKNATRSAAVQAGPAMADLSELRRLREAEKLAQDKIKTAAMERQQALENAQLVPIEQAVEDVRRLFLVVKTELRQVPSRMGQEFPELGAETMAALLRHIDRSLTTLADMG